MHDNLVFNIFNLCLIPFIIWGYWYLWKETRVPKEPKTKAMNRRPTHATPQSN